MDENEFLSRRFEAQRPRLRALAYRMLGSLAEAEDAVQEGWIKAARAGSAGVSNADGWLTTVVSRVCLDMLRSRKSRREDPLESRAAGRRVDLAAGVDPAEEAQLAETVGMAMLVVLDRLNPAERLAFVLHDMFAVPFAEIAPLVERSVPATQKLASRARARVRGASPQSAADRGRRRRAVDAFLAAARSGRFEDLVSMLDPDVVFRADPAAAKLGSPAEVRGARAVAEQFSGRARGAAAALLDGEVGIVVAPRGRLFLTVKLDFAGDRVVGFEAQGDPRRLAAIEVAALEPAAA